MMATGLAFRWLCLGLVCLLLWMAPGPLWAQQGALDPRFEEETSPWDQNNGFGSDEFVEDDFNSTPEEDLNNWGTEGRAEVLKDQPGTDPQNGGSTQQDDNYIDEDVIPGDSQSLLEAQLLRRSQIVSEERIHMPYNVGYGVGTGLMIGSWFAFLTAGTSRDTLRSIGLGIVLGGVMGAVIGSRSVLTPNAPRPPQPSTPPPQGALKTTDSFVAQTGLQLTFQWTF